MKIKDMTDDQIKALIIDVLENKYCAINGCNNKLQPGDLIYCSDCTEEINS